MRLHDGKYKVCVGRVEKLDPDTLDKSDLAINVWEGEGDRPGFKYPSGLECVIDSRSSNSHARRNAMAAHEAHVEESRFLALVLRHKPDEAGVSLDEHGWANVDELVAGMAARFPFTHEMLEEIVATDSKGRYSFDESHKFIRANQGHSVNVDVELEQGEPPAVLYHGTAKRFLDSIMSQGLLPKGRLYVHLSPDKDTAYKVGIRHGVPAVLAVNASAMYAAGMKFYLSNNGIWLTQKVPPSYLSLVETPEDTASSQKTEGA